jgi:hypothetical protein
MNAHLDEVVVISDSEESDGPPRKKKRANTRGVLFGKVGAYETRK